MKEEILREFDKLYAYQDRVSDEIPLADMHDWLRTALKEYRQSLVEEIEKMKPGENVQGNNKEADAMLVGWDAALDAVIKKLKEI